MNRGPDGTHTIMVKGPKTASLLRNLLGPLQSALLSARTTMKEISFEGGVISHSNYRFGPDNKPRDYEEERFKKDL